MPGSAHDSCLISRPYVHMARFSLVCGIVLAASSSCVIGEPDFTPPERTRPELRALDPAITEIRPQVRTESDTFATIRFDVQVISEDAGEALFAVLLINYGHRNPFDPRTPYETDRGARILKAATISEGPRLISIPYTPTLVNDSHECKSVTMLVTHKRFGISPYEECPAAIADSATLTWYIPTCDNLGDCSAQDCVGEPEGGYVYCPDDPEAALAEDDQ